MFALDETLTLETPEPVLIPGRLTGAVCQILIREIVEFEPPRLTPTAAIDATPTLMLTRYTGGLLFGWNPLRRTYEVRDADTNQLLFASEHGGKNIVKCELRPLDLETILENLKNAK